MDKEVIEKARLDLEAILENSTIQQLEEAKIGFGLSAAKFACRYVNPLKDQETYREVYNLYYDVFKSMKITTL